MDITPTGDNVGFKDVNSSDLDGAVFVKESTVENVPTDDLLGDFNAQEKPADTKPTSTELSNLVGEPLTLGSVDLDSETKMPSEAAAGNANKDSIFADFDPIKPSASNPAPEDEGPFHNPTLESEPESEPTFEPEREPTPEPIREATPEPNQEPTPDTVREPTPEPSRESTPETIPEEPVTKPKTPPPTPDPVEIEQAKPFELPKPATAPSRPSPRTDSNLLRKVDPRVLELILWRKPKITGVVFVMVFSILIALNCCSVLSVISYTLLLTTIAASGARLYKLIMAKVNNGDDEHPFKQVLDADCTLPVDKAEHTLSDILDVVNRNLPVLRNLLLVHDFIASLKFGLILYASTYIGAWFYAHTLLVLAVVGAFTLPKIYEVNRAKIDRTIEVLHSKFDDAYKQLQDKIPFLKPKQH